MILFQNDGNLVTLQAEVNLSKRALEQAKIFCSRDVSKSSRHTQLITPLVYII